MGGASAVVTILVPPGRRAAGPRQSSPNAGRRGPPIARGGAAWYTVVVCPTSGVPEGGAQGDQSHRRTRRILRERAQALQEAVREGGPPVRVQEAAALREAERPAEAQGPRRAQEGEATGADVRLGPGGTRTPPALPPPGRERVRRRVEAHHLRERGTEWDAVRALLAHEAQTAMGRERAAAAEPLTDPVAVPAEIDLTPGDPLPLA